MQSFKIDVSLLECVGDDNACVLSKYILNTIHCGLNHTANDVLSDILSLVGNIIQYS